MYAAVTAADDADRIVRKRCIFRAEVVRKIDRFRGAIGLGIIGADRWRGRQALRRPLSGPARANGGTVMTIFEKTGLTLIIIWTGVIFHIGDSNFLQGALLLAVFLASWFLFILGGEKRND